MGDRVLRNRIFGQSYFCPIKNVIAIDTSKLYKSYFIERMGIKYPMSGSET